MIRYMRGGKMTETYINFHNGTPTLFINGCPVPGAAYMTYYENNNRYGDFTEAGYRLFSVPVFFGDQTINDYSMIPPFKDGIFSAKPPDFGLVDEAVGKILQACPDAYIIPRVNINVPGAWEEENPEECLDFSFHGHRRACCSSEAWLAEVRRELGLFLDYTEKSGFSDHIAGYQLAGGMTEEFLTHDCRGNDGQRAREAFRNSDISNYYRFLNEQNAKAICEFAEFTKEKLTRKLIVGTFYGYTYECPGWNMGHHALNRVLNCPYIDFLCSPISYFGTRPADEEHPYMTVPASIKAHGKMYFTENDTRTHLSRPANSMPHYNSPVWFGHSKNQTLETIKLHSAKGIVNGHGFWWFDMWGGWFDDKDYMSLMGKIHEISILSLSLDRTSRAEMAVFTDEKACFEAKEGTEADFVTAGQQFMQKLGSAAIPFDSYLTDDFTEVYEKYRAFIFTVPQITEDMRKIIDFAKSRGLAYICITPSENNICAEKIRHFAESAGVFVYSDRKAVVYACKSLLFIYTAEEGQYKISLPESVRSDFTDLYSGEKIDFSSVLPKGRAFLFKLYT